MQYLISLIVVVSSVWLTIDIFTPNVSKFKRSQVETNFSAKEVTSERLDSIPISRRDRLKEQFHRLPIDQQEKIKLAWQMQYKPRP